MKISLFTMPLQLNNSDVPGFSVSAAPINGFRFRRLNSAKSARRNGSFFGPYRLNKPESLITLLQVKLVISLFD